MKLCKDCKYSKVGFFSRVFCGYEFAKCLSPKTNGDRGKFFVSGDGRDAFFCSTARDYEHLCGLNAENFEPKGKK